jgi:hypothetical protein
MVGHQDQRRHLDLLFLIDSVVSLAFGVAALVSPHGLLQKIGSGEKGCFVLVAPGVIETILSYSLWR